RHREKTFPCPVRPTGLRPARESVVSVRALSTNQKETLSETSGFTRSRRRRGAWRKPYFPPAHRFTWGRSDPFSALLSGSVSVGWKNTPLSGLCSRAGKAHPLRIFRKGKLAAGSTTPSKNAEEEGIELDRAQSPDQGNLCKLRLFYPHSTAIIQSALEKKSHLSRFAKNSPGLFPRDIDPEPHAGACGSGFPARLLSPGDQVAGHRAEESSTALPFVEMIQPGFSFLTREGPVLHRLLDRGRAENGQGQRRRENQRVRHHADILQPQFLQ